MFEKRKCKSLIKKQEERLLRLKGTLEKYSNLPQDPKLLLERFVEFFNDVSKFQDEGSFDVGYNIKMEKHFPEAYKQLCIINKHLENAGRCRSGFNRTVKGQTVTIDDVFLGDVFGIWTFSVRKWIYETPEDRTHLDIIDKQTKKPIWLTKLISEYQVRPFIISHLNAINSINDVISAF